MHDQHAHLLITLGGLLLLGVVTDFVGRRTPLPRVTLLLLLGIVVGPAGFDLLAGISPVTVSIVTDMAMLMVGFLLGETLTTARLRARGRTVLVMSAAIVLATVVTTAIGLACLGTDLAVALVLGAVAAATDPVATRDVVAEARADGPFTDTLLAIVAIDDAWGLVAFSILLAVAQAVSGTAGAGMALVAGARDLGGAVLVGVAVGVPMARITGRIRAGEPTLVEALGLVLLCGGFARWLDVSFLLAAIVMGTVVANLARHHTRPFHAIAGIEHPFLVLFFLLAGTQLDPRALPALGLAGLGYLACRVGGRVFGTWVGGRLAGTTARHRHWMAFALLPQGGVALGMALVATEHLPADAQVILPIAIGSTVLFELVGPFCARQALSRVGEAGARRR